MIVADFDFDVAEICVGGRAERWLRGVNSRARRVRNLVDFALRVVEQKNFAVAVFVVARVGVSNSIRIEGGNFFGGDVAIRFDHDKATVGRSIAGKRITVHTAQTLLKQGRSQVLKGFASKSGKPFEARLRLEGGEVRFEFGS